MRFKFKKALALLSAAAMCGGMALSYPDGAFSLDRSLSASAAGDSTVPLSISDIPYEKATISAYEEPDYDESKGGYQISNASELYWFADQVNSGNASFNAVVVKDIIVNENVLDENGELNAESTFIEWIPIGNTSSNRYTGTFNGDNHTISGLYFNDETESRVGLFGQNSGTIKNVGVIDSYISASDAVSGVCGFNNGGTISYCYNKGSIISNTTSAANTGGICGTNTGSGIISNCYNEGIVSADLSYVGGVCGINNKGSIENCYNSGAVSGSSYIGGVCGQTRGAVTNSYNTGNVIASVGSVGGVCGQSYSSASITKCYNTGSVEGISNVGGVCGDNRCSMTNSFNSGTVVGTSNIGGIFGCDAATSSVSSCYSSGSVSEGTSSGGIGGKKKGTVENCFYTNDSQTVIGAIAGQEDADSNVVFKSAAQFSSGEVAYLLQGSQTETVWGQNLDNDETVQSYPVLGEDKVYCGYKTEYCGNTEADRLYSNTEFTVASIPEHSYKDGVCIKCTETCTHESYTGGICDECESYEDGVGAKLAGYSLSLEGNIGVNFYMELDDSVIADSEAYMQFTLGGKELSSMKVSEANVDGENFSKTYYVFNCEVPAKDMDTAITAQIVLSDGTKGTVYEYTVKEYADYILDEANNYDNTTRNLVNAMLSYGDYAEAYFNGTDLAATEAMDAVTADTLAEYACTVTDDNSLYYGSSLLLKSNTIIRHYFTEEVTGSTQKGDLWYIDTESISADKLGTAITTELDGISISYSPLSYAYKALSSDTTSESLKNLVKALYLYHLAICDYAGYA